MRSKYTPRPRTLGDLARPIGPSAPPLSPKARAIARPRIVQELYLPTLLPAIALIAFGLVVVWSASLTIPEASLPRQLIGVALGFAIGGFIWRYDYRDFQNFTTAFLIVDIALFLLPMIPGLGYTANGMTGWIQIPLIGLRIQPSEIMKLVTIYLIAALGASYHGKIKELNDYLKLCVYLAIPFLLLVTQDLGSSLIVLVSGAAIIICSGAKPSWVWTTIGLMVAFIALVVWSSLTEGMPHLLHDYQLNRLIVFVDPSVDPTGDGYNLQQSMIAVGSGGFLGKGVGNATQALQGFLPEAQTDFAFALLAEEFGFLGTCVLLFLYGWLIFGTIRLAQGVDYAFAKLVLVGVVAMWSFQVLENIGMCLGIMPITGIPLPFISYGASSMVVQIASVGMVQSVWYHRTKSG